MKVLIDFTGPIGGDTGGATYATNLLPLWVSEAADEVLALFSYGQTPDAARGLPGVSEVRAGVVPRPEPASVTSDRARARPARIALPRLSPRWLLERHLGVGRELRRRDVDVAFFPGNYVALRVPERVPSVVAVRSMLHYHYPAQLPLTRRLYRRAATRHAVAAAERVIVPSSATADDLMRWAFAERRKIVVVPHGVDLELFRPDGCVPRRLDRFLYVSKPWDYKGLATVLRALAELHRRPLTTLPHLAVADGGLAPVDIVPWRQLAQRLRVDEHIDFLGRVAHEELAYEYGQASALVLPTSIESFGNIFLEAAACGCPVITGRGHGIDESIGDVAMQVLPHRHSDLADAMQQCLEMSEGERQERARVMRSWAERFPWSRTLASTRDVLSEVA